jgi:hypothetical protein
MDDNLDELPITPKTVTAHYIVGVSLTRVQVITVKKKGAYEDWLCAVREISDGDLDGGCDGCDKQHSTINVNCSMNNKLKLKTVDRNGLYILGRTAVPPIKFKIQFDVDFAFRNGRTLKKGYTTFRVLHSHERKTETAKRKGNRARAPDKKGEGVNNNNTIKRRRRY